MAVFFGTELGETLEGGADDDLIRGFQGDDTILGRGGDDVLYDGFGNDTVRGGAGNDTLINIGGASDLFDGGSGFDLFQEDLRGFQDDYDLITVDLENGIHRAAGAANFDTLQRIEAFRMFGAVDIAGFGTADANVFETDRGRDTLRGAGGDDLLDGGRNRDKLFGDGGRDTLIGGRGNDVSTGGAGADSFVFEEGDGADRIRDFGRGADKLLLDVSFYEIGESVADFVDRVADTSGANLVLRFGNGDRITLQGISDTADIVDSIEFI